VAKQDIFLIGLLTGISLSLAFAAALNLVGK